MMNPSGVSGGSPPWCRSAQSAATAIRYSKRFPHPRHLRLEAGSIGTRPHRRDRGYPRRHGCDSSWDTVEHWLASQSDAELQGLSWQRRGHLLAKRGDLDGTRDAYRRAMVAWSQPRDYSEQVGDCVLSLQAAESLLGVWDVDATARSPAFSLESSHRTPAGDAPRLQERAASNRIARRFIDAHREYWLAYAAYKRCGKVGGVLHVSRNLQSSTLRRATPRTQFRSSSSVATRRRPSGLGSNSRWRNSTTRSARSSASQEQDGANRRLPAPAGPRNRS